MPLAPVAPPDVPADRLKALQTAFMDMTKDPTFVEEIGKMGQDLSLLYPERTPPEARTVDPLTKSSRFSRVRIFVLCFVSSEKETIIR